MEIVAYGSTKAECRKCRETEAVVREVVEALGAGEAVSFETLTLQSERAATEGVMVTPTVTVDGEIVVDGGVPDRDKLTEYLRSLLG